MHVAYATSTPQIISCQPPFSFYRLVDQLAIGDVKYQNLTADRPMHRFCSLMRKTGARSLIYEELEPNQELSGELEMFRAATKTNARMKFVRITAFRASTSPDKWRERAHVPDEAFLGYAVIVQVTAPPTRRSSYLHEAVVALPTLELKDTGAPPALSLVGNYYIHNARQFPTTIGTKTDHRTVKIIGTFFAQQNAVSHVCAHAALRTAINSSPRFRNKPKLTNKYINDVLALKWPEIQRGLTQQQMTRVIEHYGGHVQTASFLTKPYVEYDQFIYPLMESGCPVILVVEGREFGHAMSVMGHTINTDRWEPEARGAYRSYPNHAYLPAVLWTDHLICSDDNFGMNVTVPCGALRNFLIPQKSPFPHASVAMGIVPRGVHLWGFTAEQRAQQLAALLAKTKLYNQDPYWYSVFKNRIQNCVCRTLLQSRSQYTKHIEAIHAQIDEPVDPSLLNRLAKLPSKLWVTELSVPNLYTANQRKIGEILHDAGANQHKHQTGESLVAIRLPGSVRFFRPNFSRVIPVQGHTPLIVERQDGRRCDW